MADFEDMTRFELVDLCTKRGLPTYGAKAALAARLHAVGEATVPGLEPDTALDPGATPEIPVPHPVREFSATYEVDKFDDDTHTELCARIVADAATAGYVARSDGRRISGADGRHTYGVAVR